jgi:hypothetical protein
LGDRVTLEIETSHRHARPGRLREETAALATTVTGRLGEWISLGEIADLSSESLTSLEGIRSSAQDRLQGLEIRVTRIP